MWSPLLFCLLIGLVAGKGAWKPGQEYVYKINSRSLTALPDNEDYWSGLLARGYLKITVKSDNEFIGELTEYENVEVTKHLSDGWSTYIPSSSLNYKTAFLSKSVFIAKLKDNLINSLIVDNSMHNHEINVLKGIVSQLIVDIRGVNQIKCKHNQLPSNDNPIGNYKVMEQTVTGKCESLYDMSPLPEYLLQSEKQWAPLNLSNYNNHFEIYKTKNYSNCDDRIGFSFGVTGESNFKPNSNQMGTSLTKSGVSRIVVSGSLDDHVIQSSVTTNKVIASPSMTDSKNAVAVAQVNLTIVSYGKSQSEPKGVSNPIEIGGPVYIYNLPSDSHNKIRTDNSSESGSRSRSGYRSGSDSDGQRYDSARNYGKHQSNEASNEEDYDEQYNGGKSRPRRYNLNAIKKYGYGKNKNRDEDRNESDNSSGSDESYENFSKVNRNQQNYQPQPSLDNAPEEPFLPNFVGRNGNSLKNNKDFNPVAHVNRLSQQIAYAMTTMRDMSAEFVFGKFNILVSLLHSLDYNQYKEISKTLYTKEKQRPSFNDVLDLFTWKIFRDATAQSGTGPALRMIEKWSNDKQVSGNELADILGSLAKSARYPTAEYLNKFYEIVKSEQVQKHQGCKSAAYLSLTRLMENSVVNNRNSYNYYPVACYGRVQTKQHYELLKDVFQHVAQQLHSAIKKDDSTNIQLYTTALGNLGVDSVAAVFNKYLQGQESVTDYQRLAMVLAFEKLTKNNPNLARNVLFNVYQNIGEVDSVRCAAVFLIIRAAPPAAMLQRMAEQTHSDPSNQARSCVKSMLESAASAESPDYEDVSKNAAAAYKLLNEETMSLAYSRSDIRSYLFDEIDAHFNGQYSHIGSSDSSWPKAILSSIEKNFGGFRTESKEHLAMVSSVKRLLDVMNDQFTDKSGEFIDKPSQRGDWTISKIAKYLQIETDEAEQLEGQIYGDFFDGKRMFSFDNETLNKAPRWTREFAQKLKNGYSFNNTKYYQQHVVEVGHPLESGIILVYSSKKTNAYKFGGYVQATTNPNMAIATDDTINMFDTANATAQLQIAVGSMEHVQLEIINPETAHSFSSGFIRKSHINLPIQLRADIDRENDNIRTSIEPLYPKNNTRVVHFSCAPFVGTRDITLLAPLKENDASKINFLVSQDQSKFRHQFGKRNTGFGFELQGSHSFKYADLHAALQHFKLSQGESPMKKMIFDSATQYDVSIVYKSEETSAERVEINLSREQIPVQYSKEALEASVEQRKQQWSEAAAELLGAEHDNDVIAKVRQGTLGGHITFAKADIDFVGKDENDKKSLNIRMVHGYDPIRPSTQILFGCEYESNRKRSQVCAHAGSYFPHVPVLNYVKSLNADPTSEAHFTLWTDKCNTNQLPNIDIRAKLTQSKERKNHIRNSGIGKQCQEWSSNNQDEYSCRNVTYKANELDSGEFLIKYYNIGDEYKNATHLAYGLLRNIYGDYHSENVLSNTGKPGQIKIETNFAPDMQSIDVAVETPILDAEFKSVRVNQYGRAILAPHPTWSLGERLESVTVGSPKCLVDKTIVSTYDNVRYLHNLGKCWHILVHSAPANRTDNDNDNHNNNNNNNENNNNNHHQIALMVRQSGGKNQKELMIVVGSNSQEDYSVQFKPTALNPRIYINKKEYIYNDKFGKDFKPIVVRATGSVEPIIHIMSTTDKELRIVVANKFVIYYNMDRILVDMDDKYRGSVRGMCGTLNGEQKDDFTTPENCIVSKPETFINSYAILDKETCDDIVYRRIQESRNNNNNHKTSSCIRKTVELGSYVTKSQSNKFQSYGGANGIYSSLSN